MTETVFTFDTTHMALWAEEVVGHAGVPCEVVPAPPTSGALCDLALAVRTSRAADAEAAMRDAGVVFRDPQPADLSPR
jgi:hypothetical protein